jgi:NADH-quinone oxidoreductase subunit M
MHSENIQAISSFIWPILPRVNVVFGIDMTSLLLMLAVHLAILVGVFAIRHERKSQKSVLFFTMCFLGSCNAYFAAVDIFSFYTFFVLMIFPLFMQTGIIGGDKKYKMISRFYIYNFIGAFLFLSAIVTIYALEGKSVEINQIASVKLDKGYGIWVWSAIFLAFVSRIPVWPFHYWITSFSANIKNPLVFIEANIIPVVGLYGFVRFWPANIPDEISSLAPIFEMFCILTMLFISFSVYSNTSVKEKLFAYTLVYYLLYLIGVFLPTDILIDNIAYSLFAFILVMAALTMIVAHIEAESEKLSSGVNGILCLQPKTSLAYSMLVLAAIGLPVSALFWNNFIIISEIFNVSLYIGTAVIITLVLAAVSLLQNLYTLKDDTCPLNVKEKIHDIDTTEFVICIVVLLVLFLSLFKPLWFVY